MSEKNYSWHLRRIAENDYMIDGKYLDDGKLLLEIADELESLERLLDVMEGHETEI